MASVADQNQPTKKPTLATDQEEEHQDLDFISHLPDEILHTIISKLQIRNAAVTTAVSKRWGPIFPTLPSLNIFAGSFDPFEPRYNQYVRNRIKWVDALFSVLNSRKSAVKKFDIAVALKPDNDDFYEVIRDVCIAGVEELSIKNTSSHSCYETPLSVFNSNTIVKLNICYCTLEVPSKLTGLQSLKSLGLTNVTVEDDDLQRMISWCKAMENLSIIDCFKVKNIVICAPSLSELF
ncbi:F-box/FBD/LRR-repeat protein At5g56420-like [Carex rostrata]